MGDRKDIALFPLSTVLFPGGRLPLRIFETRYVDMVSACLRDDQPFGVVPIRHGSEVGRGADFYPHGTLATIASWDQGADQLLNIVALGGQAFDVHEHAIQADGLVTGTVQGLTDDDLGIPSDLTDLVTLLTEVYRSQPEIAPAQPWLLGQANWVAYRLCELMPLPNSSRVEVLTAGSGHEKLQRVAAFLQRPAKPQA